MLNSNFDPYEVLVANTQAILDLNNREQQLKRNEEQVVFAINQMNDRLRRIEDLLNLRTTTLGPPKSR